MLDEVVALSFGAAITHPRLGFYMAVQKEGLSTAGCGLMPFSLRTVRSVYMLKICLHCRPEVKLQFA